MYPTPRIAYGKIIGGSLVRQIPFLALFYFFDYFIWSSNGGSSTPGNDANLVANILFSSLFIMAFFGIDVGRQVWAARRMIKNPPAPPQQQIVYVQQPVYVQGPPPPGYQQQQGYPQQYAPPPQLPPQTPPGQPRDPRGGGQQ